jgi:CRP-like cAMP-binding protein
MIESTNVIELEEFRGRTSMLHQQVFTYLNGLFNHLTVDDWSAIFDRGEFISFEDGQRILLEGMDNDCLYYVDEGEVRVVRTDNGKEFELARLRSGSLFGEMSMIDDAPASATVVAHGIVDVIRIDRADLERMFRRDPALGLRFYRSLAETLSRRLRKTNRWARSVS